MVMTQQNNASSSLAWMTIYTPYSLGACPASLSRLMIGNSIKAKSPTLILQPN